MLKSYFFSKHLYRRLAFITRKYGAATQLNASDNRFTNSISKYFAEHGLTDILTQVPPTHLMKYRNVEFCTIVNPKLAKKIAYAICSRMDDGFVIESDPGFGFMTEFLVSAFPHVCLCERNKEFRSNLERFNAEHEKVRIFNFNFSTMVKMSFISKIDSVPEYEEFLQHVTDKIQYERYEKINWIFSALNCRLIKLLCTLILCDFPFQKSVKIEYYFLLPSKYYKILSNTCAEKFTHRFGVTTVLFQLLFNHQVLMDEIPRKMFLPWLTQKRLDSEFVLIHAVPNADLLSLFQSNELGILFLKFLTVGLRKGRRVIPVLETFVNNCGPTFIVDHDLTVYTEFLDLSSAQLLSIFQTFSKLPEFHHSSFVADNLEEFLKVNESAEENVEEKVADDDIDLSEDSDDEKDDGSDSEDDLDANEIDEESSKYS